MRRRPDPSEHRHPTFPSIFEELPQGGDKRAISVGLIKKAPLVRPSRGVKWNGSDTSNKRDGNNRGCCIQQARYIQYARPSLFTFVCSRRAAEHVAPILFHRSQADVHDLFRDQQPRIVCERKIDMESKSPEQDSSANRSIVARRVIPKTNMALFHSGKTLRKIGFLLKCFERRSF